MFRLPKSVLSFCGGALALGVLILAAPRAAHAIAATLVQVTNTAANPVPNLDTERNARIPYQSTINATPCSVGPCDFLLSTVPVGYRLVAQSVSVDVKDTTVPQLAFLADATYSFTSSFSAPVYPSGNQSHAGGTQAVTAYFDAGVTPLVGFWGGTGTMSVALFGYLESCTVTNCAPIQH
jgi:hypothetical protein